MKLDYLRLCSRASGNPGFIWFCDFPSIAGRLLRDYLAEPLHHAFMKANAPCASREGLQLFFFLVLWGFGPAAPPPLAAAAAPPPSSSPTPSSAYSPSSPFASPSPPSLLFIPSSS